MPHPHTGSKHEESQSSIYIDIRHQTIRHPPKGLHVVTSQQNKMGGGDFVAFSP
jgi:hypothetical protein